MKKTRTLIGGVSFVLIGILVSAILYLGSLTNPPLAASIATPTNPLEDILQAENYLEQQTLLEIEIQNNPANAAAHYRLGLILVLLGPEKAEAHLTQASALDAQYAANSQLMQNTLLRASLQEDTAYQMVLIGQTLGALEEWALANLAFEYATTINDTYTEAWAYLGEARQQTGDEDALEALHTALKLDPESLATNLFLGMYWRRNSRPDLALSYFEHAAKLAPNTPAIQVEIGQTLASTGEVQAALAYYQEAIALAPDQKEAWQTFAAYAIEHEIHVSTIGLPAARQALLLDKTDPYTLTLLGRAYALLRETDLATRFYNQAIAFNETDPAAYYYLGLLQYVNGDVKTAQANIQQAALLDPLGEIGTLAEGVLTNYFSTQK